MIGGVAAEECLSPRASHVSALWASVIYCIAHNTPGALCPAHHLHSFCPALWRPRVILSVGKQTVSLIELFYPLVLFRDGETRSHSA